MAVVGVWGTVAAQETAEPPPTPSRRSTPLAWWHDPTRPATLAVSDAPRGVAFDGSNIWVPNVLSDTVSKLRP